MVRLFRRRHDAARAREQVIRSRSHTGFFLPGNRMRPDKMDAGRHRPFRLFHQHTLHAADIGHDRAVFQAGRPLLQMPIIGIDRRGQDDEIGIPHSLFGVYDVAIDRTKLDGGLRVFNTPSNSDDAGANPFRRRIMPSDPPISPTPIIVAWLKCSAISS